MKNKEGLIQAFENIKQALKTNNIDVLDRLIVNEYRGFTLNGTVETKADILKYFKPGLIHITSYVLLEVEYEVFSEVGIVSGKGFIEGSFQEHTFEHTVYFMDVFKYEEHDWRYYKSQVTEVVDF
jgi:hypothetical protein